MNLYEKFLNDIQWEAKKKGITKKELSKAVGVSETQLSLIFNNKSGSIKTINSIVNFIESK